MKEKFINTIGLQTPGGRLLFFTIASVGIFFAHYDWLNGLSIWQHLGIPSSSIGLTRAYWLLIHGDPVGAWQRNKLIYVVIAIGAPILAKDAITLYRASRAKK